MKLLGSVSIKNFLLGVVGLLVLILTILSVSSFYAAYNDSREIERTNAANLLADKVLLAAGEQAKERGFTATALSSRGAIDPKLVSMINSARKTGNEQFKEARMLTAKIMQIDGSNQILEKNLAASDRYYAQVESARQAIDRGISNGQAAYQTADWVKLMTNLIEANAQLRLASMASDAGSKKTLQEAMRLNIELKQAIWVVSEYAGRERAALGAAIASGMPIEPATLGKLNNYRAIIDLNLKPIYALRETPGIDPEVLASIARMNEVFLGSYDTTRKSVYDAAAKGAYAITPDAWITSSTAAIDTVLGVSHSISRVVDAKYADLALSKRTMMISTAVLAVIILLGLSSLWIIKTKVVEPMRNLSAAITDIERTGDLRTTINVASKDESGQIAIALNNMISKFHSVIREIHKSSEHLASSSEELSASAVQIAGGSKSQSAKAMQVSTASQQMSTTIIEVAKNVSSASDAAKDASKVAVSGGMVVERTITSMKGIAETARASSSIIANLGTRSNEIGNIINVIDDIADQTNLLALNAAIEAARAGEQGRGFAVVADEVRKLAEKTQKATKEIGEMISSMQNETSKAIASMDTEIVEVQNGVKLAVEAGGALKEIVSKVEIVTDMIHQVTTAMEEQSAVTEQISSDIEAVAGVINETSTSADQIAAASESMARLATNLKTTVELFKVSGSGDGVHIKRINEQTKKRLENPEDAEHEARLRLMRIPERSAGRRATAA